MSDPWGRTFGAREEHLRQRATRGWIEDEDVMVCVAEIDRLRAALAVEAPAGLDEEVARLREAIAKADDFLNKKGDPIAAHITLWEAINNE